VDGRGIGGNEHGRIHKSLRGHRSSPRLRRPRGRHRGFAPELNRSRAPSPPLQANR
jgi:hypothetical protein